MALDFDEFPLYDPVIKDPATRKLSDVWRDFLSTFYQSLTGYLSQNGMFVPILNQDQVDAIQSPIEGQMIYNSTAIAPQIYQDGAWKTFTTV